MLGRFRTSRACICNIEACTRLDKDLRRDISRDEALERGFSKHNHFLSSRRAEREKGARGIRGDSCTPSFASFLVEFAYEKVMARDPHQDPKTHETHRSLSFDFRSRRGKRSRSTPLKRRKHESHASLLVTLTRNFSTLTEESKVPLGTEVT